MNYEANTTQWKPGDLVVHDCDAKTPDMLMRVVNYTHDGLCRTEYVKQTDIRLKRWGRGKRSRLVNRVAVLHDPKRFSIPTPAKQNAATDR